MLRVRRTEKNRAAISRTLDSRCFRDALVTSQWCFGHEEHRLLALHNSLEYPTVALQEQVQQAYTVHEPGTSCRVRAS